VDLTTLRRRAAATVAALAATCVIAPALSTAVAAPASAAPAPASVAARAAAPANVTPPKVVAEYNYYGFGEPLTADPGTWDAEGLTFAYQWQVGGADVAGATGSTYTATREQYGEQLAVVVTATGTDGTSAPVSSAPVTVDKGQPHFIDEPTISGEPRVGSTMTVDPGSWDVEDIDAQIEWFGEDYEVMAVGPTYELRPGDVGRDISVGVTLEAPDYLFALYFLGTGTVEPGTLTQQTAPRITGTPAAGRTLTVAPGTYSETAGVTVTHQWTVDGAEAGTGEEFTVPASAVGKRIAVVETASGFGWNPASQTSTAVKATKAPATVALRLTSPARGKVKATVTVRSSVPATGKVTVKVGQRSRTVTLRRGKAVVTLVGLRKGATRATARYAGSSAVTAGSDAASVRVK
jgi:hypothetical protein